MAWFYNGRKYWYHNGKRYSKSVRRKRKGNTKGTFFWYSNGFMNSNIKNYHKNNYNYNKLSKKDQELADMLNDQELDSMYHADYTDEYY